MYRALLFLAFVGIVLGTSPVSAQTKLRSCPRPLAAPPPKQFSLGISMLTTAGKQQKAQEMLIQTDQCSDQRVDFDLNNYRILLSTTRACKKDDAEYGCAKSKKPPTLCITIPNDYGGGAIRVSKCDKSKLNQAFTASLSSDYGPMTSLAQETEAQIAHAQQALLPEASQPTSQTTALSNQDALARALAATGISEAKAKEIVEKDPREAEKLLSYIASGDEKAVAESKRVLDLNPELTLDQKRAQTAIDEKAAQDKLLLNGDEEENRRVVTGFEDDEQARGEFEKRARISPELESYVDGMRGHGCANGNLSCRTNNPGAMRYSSWMQQYGGYSCGQSNDAACFPSVEAGLAAKIDLVQRRMAQGCDTIYTLLENCQYAARNAGNDSWAYAMTVGRMTGFGPNGKIDPQNADQMGRLVTAMAWYEGGRGIGFNGEQLDKALKVAYKQDTLPVGDPNFQPGVRFAYNAPEYSPSYSTSPFANVTPYGSNAPPSQTSSGFSFGSNLSNTNPPRAPVQPVTIPPQNTNPIPVPGLNNNQTSPLTLPYIPVDPPAGTTKPAVKETFVEPIASIFVQPRSVSKGARVLVSWAGLGVSTKQPCTVTAENTAGQLVIAERNEGSRSIVATSTGLMKFTIQCTTPAGASLQRSESVMVL